jgi:hypothetical protein
MNAHTQESTSSNIGAHSPMLSKESRAGGLSAQITSRKLPGNNSDNPANALIAVADTKKMLSAVMARGRNLGAVGQQIAESTFIGQWPQLR